MSGPRDSKEFPQRKGASTSRRRSLPRPTTTRTIAICNQKGGCGKTTTVINLAGGLASSGLKVLVVDLDAQCNSTSGLGVSADAVEKSIFDVMLDPKGVSLNDIVLETEFPGLHLAPGSLDLAEFDIRAAGEIGRENRLKRALAQIPAGFYDYILLDTPPSLGLLLVNALNAASEIHITMQAHPFAFEGLNKLIDTIEAVREELNPTLEISGVIVTMFDGRTRISREIVERLQARDDLRDKVYDTLIRQNVRLAEAAKVRKPIMHFDPGCVGTQDYLALCREVSKRRTASKAQVISSNPG